MNNCSLIGRIGTDIVIKKTNTGKSVMQIQLAVKRNKEITDWIPVVLWEQQAEFLANYAKKGDLISIEGQIQSRQYESNGQKRTAIELKASKTELLSHSERNQTSAGGNPVTTQNTAQTAQNQPTWGDPIEIGSDDLPF